MFICVDALPPSQQFFNHVGMISCIPGLRIKCFAQGHKTVTPTSLEFIKHPFNPQSNVLPTEPLHSGVRT